MSQFRAREWWRTVAGDGNEEFNPSAMCVANCDNQPTGSKIVVGSLKGCLRVYQPTPNGFQASDVLAEKNLGGDPILQVMCGRFGAHDKDISIAVLMPRRLAVYSLRKQSKSAQAASGATTGGSSDSQAGAAYTLEECYRHALKHVAYNMCQGSFGKTDGTECICVQSLDGMIYTFDAAVLHYGCYLPSFLLPGPIAYSQSLTALLTASSTRQVQCFKYTAIAKAATSHGLDTLASQSTQRVSPDWSVDLGEMILDIHEVMIDYDRKRAVPGIGDVEEDEDDTCLMVLGERSLFCIGMNGVILFAKKLDSPASCFAPYALSCARPDRAGEKPSVEVLTLLSYHDSGSLAVLSNTRLAWATNFPTSTPIAVAVASFGSQDKEQRGLIVTLGDNGCITCSYLGTEPLQQVNPLSQRRNTDVTTGDIEKLMQLIDSIEKREAPPEDIDVKKVTTELRVETQQRLIMELPPGELVACFGEGNEGAPRPCAVVKLTIHAPSEGGAHEVAVTVRCVEPVIVNPPGIVVSRVAAGSSSELLFHFFVASDTTVCNASATVVASYTSATGYPNSLVHNIRLPITLFAKSVKVVKDAACKMVLNSNKPCVDLLELFSDVERQTESQNHNALTLSLPGGMSVSILAAKHSNRYRIQSEVFQALWMVMEEFADRLEKYFSTTDSTKSQTAPLELSITSDLPLKEYFALIDDHLEKRKALNESLTSLEQRAAEFRMLQKRLLIRIKQQTPTHLGCLDMLLSRSYQHIMDILDIEETQRQELNRSSVELSAGTRTMLILLRFYLRLTPEEVEMFGAVLSPEISSPTDPIGWEEMTDASLIHVISTHFHKTKDESEVVLDTNLTMPSSSIELKRHIALLIKRVQNSRGLAEPEAEAAD
ncbi:protein PTHB1-like [Sycon ciliatum]|uniref:protein PTHB1-like n=1 Tax=Sycon ciliatum TaxID=27933 RepID=UPI0031F66C21